VSQARLGIAEPRFDVTRDRKYIGVVGIECQRLPDMLAGAVRLTGPESRFPQRPVTDVIQRVQFDRSLCAGQRQGLPLGEIPYLHQRMADNVGGGPRGMSPRSSW